jgi:hypothetical protein
MFSLTGKLISWSPIILFMKELSVEETTELANAYVKTFGYREAARKLTERGYKSREGKEIRHAHLSRILSGSPSQFLGPEPEAKEEPLQKPPERSPAKPLESLEGSLESSSPAPGLALTPRPGYQEQSPSPLPLVVKAYQEPVAIPLEETEREEALRELHTKNRKALKAELEDGEELRKLKESELPALVPGPSGRGEHPHVQQMAKVTGIFTRRGPALELEEEKTYYGIPAMQRKSSVTTTRPHEVTHFGANVLSTRDLSIRQKKRS